MTLYNGEFIGLYKKRVSKEKLVTVCDFYNEDESFIKHDLIERGYNVRQYK